MSPKFSILEDLPRVERIFDDLEDGKTLSKSDLIFIDRWVKTRKRFWTGFDSLNGLERARMMMKDMGLESVNTGKDKNKAKTQVNLGKKTRLIKAPKPKTKVKLG